MDIKINVRNLKLDMFVVRLDRSWLGTPFPFQGFWIRDPEEIQYLRGCCEFVYIRVDKDGKPTDYAEVANVDWKDRVMKADREIAPIDFLPKRPVNHLDSVAVEEEMVPAHFARRNLKGALDEVVNDIRRGKQIAIINLKEVVTGVTESVLRNPDAFMWLRLVKDRDTYTYYHLLDTSVLAVALGRHLGFDRHELADLGLGALLIDIGKLKLAPELIMKPTCLSEDERAQVEKHVEYGLQLIERVPGINKCVTEIVAAHHERIDGKGYPRGLGGRSIPAFARMVAIADCFDAITSDRPYAKGLSPHEAMCLLYEWSGKAFQRELVEHFIQCLGIYPTGTLVELNSGEVGVVIGQNRVRRLKPRLMILLGPDKTPLETFPVMDLMDPLEGADPVVIKRAVEPEEYGIDPRQYYISRVKPDAAAGTLALPWKID